MTLVTIQFNISLSTEDVQAKCFITNSSAGPLPYMWHAIALTNNDLPTIGHSKLHFSDISFNIYKVTLEEYVMNAETYWRFCF